MRISKYIFLLSLSLFVSMGALAQNNTSSPYSRFGYGELNDNVPGAYRALGGVGIGMRSNKVINPAQPASYTVVDSTTFMFDLAASVMWDQYEDASGVRNKANGNLEYLSIQFPIWKKHIAMSLGFMPYSMVGYSFSMSDSINSDYHYSKSYAGEGGISELYGGLSFNICDWFALGANIYYMFGSVSNYRSVLFTESLNSISQSSVMTVSDVRFRYGAQFFHQFEKHSFAVGAIFENKSALRGQYMLTESTTADTVANDSSILSDWPMTWGVGVSYTYANRLTLAADYTTYCWADARYYDTSVNLRNRSKLSVGVEYVHNPSGRRYVDHMPWRLGFSMADSYVKTIPGRDYTVSIGTAFPLHNVGTIINTTLEYGHRGSANILQENYLKFTINASISENWFFKRRL